MPTRRTVTGALLFGVATSAAVRRRAVAADPATAGGGAPATGAALTPAEQGWVGRIEAYLNGIATLKARFLQIDQSGRTSNGVAWLDRPGRMRFQYDKPSGLLLVADGTDVWFDDPKVGQVTKIPLDRTPLGLLLAPNVTLSGAVTVTAFEHGADDVSATVVRTASPGDGSLTLVFSTAPFALRSWSVLDAEGRETRVDLYDVALGVPAAPSLFRFTPPDNG